MVENEWTREDCIEELLRLFEECPKKIITRSFFRENSLCPEKYVYKHFGTFLEFKRQAGIELTRYQRKFLDNVAYNVSNDSIRKYNEEKMSYEDKYLRPCSKKFQTIVFASDFHDIKADEFSVNVFYDVLKRVQPTSLVLGGDIFESYEFNRFNVDVRKWNLIKSIKWVHAFLENIRNIIPDAQIDFIAGNHETVILRHLYQQSPQMLNILSDLHGFTLSTLLGLDKYEINFISRNDLSVYKESDIKKEISKNYIIKHGCIAYTHYPTREFGMNTVYGHNHKYHCESVWNASVGNYELVQSGAMCLRNAEYTHGNKWTNGFLISHLQINDKFVQNEYINTTFNHCVVGGKWYERNENQILNW